MFLKIHQKRILIQIASTRKMGSNKRARYTTHTHTRTYKYTNYKLKSARAHRLNKHLIHKVMNILFHNFDLHLRNTRWFRLFRLEMRLKSIIEIKFRNQICTKSLDHVYVCIKNCFNRIIRANSQIFRISKIALGTRKIHAFLKQGKISNKLELKRNILKKTRMSYSQS